MLSYDVVWVTNNSQWSYNGIDGTLLSDKLGEFIDKGGKLLESACMMSDHPLWGLNGGAYVEEEKSPFTISTGELNFESNVVFNQPNHPILNNVSSFTADNNENIKIRDNALLIASLDNGVPYIGVNSNVVAINEYIGNVYNSDKLKLMANSLIYLSGVDIPEVENLTVFGEDDNAKLIWQKPAIEEPDFFTESFEDTELPEGWEITTTNASATWTFSSTNVFDGTQNIYCNWSTNPQDEFLKTKKFVVPAGGYLEFWTWLSYGGENDNHRIVISTDDWESQTTLWEGKESNLNENPVVVDLGKFAGQLVSLAWNASSPDGLTNPWFIDNVSIKTTANKRDNSVITYKIFKDNVLIDEVADLHYEDPNVEDGKTYTYCVQANYDNLGLSSLTCDDVTVNMNITDNNFDKINIYPNPASNFVFIDGISIENIKIFDNSGKLVGVTSSNKIDLSNYANGIYIMQISDIEGVVHSRKIIKN